MTFKVSDGAGGRTVYLSGEIDLERSPEARKVLLAAVAAGKGDVCVDLAEVSYMDSSGIASLVEALQHAKAKGRALVLERVSPPVDRILSLARLDKVFTIRSKAG